MALNQNYNVGVPSKKLDPSAPKDTKSLMRRAAASPFAGGLPIAEAMGAATTQVNKNIAATTAPEAAPAGGPATTADNISQDNLAVANAMGGRLANGVRRYQMDGRNAVAGYVTRGKDGSVVFTDDANYAARNSAGGLRRGEIPDEAYVHTQGPRAEFEYAKSGLEQKGLRRQDFHDLTPEQTQAAFDYAGDAASKAPNADIALSNQIDANMLRAHKFDQDQRAAEAAASIDPRTQIALFRAQTAAERNTIAQGQLEATREGVRRQGAAEDRAAQKDFFSQYQALKANDPKSAENYLFNAIPNDPKQFDQWAATPAGRSVLNTYMTDYLQPQAQSSLFPLEWGDSRQVPHLNYGNLDLGPNEDGFKGIINPDGNTDEYPAQGLFGTDNYNSINRFSPAILRRLKRLNTETQ